MTKEEAVRAELRFGKERGMLKYVPMADPRIKLVRLYRLVEGAPMEDGEVGILWDALNLDDDALEDETE